MNLMKKETITLLINGKKQRARRFWLVTLFLGIGALFLCCAMLMMGNTIYPPEIILRALLGEEIQGASYAVNTIRFPRMLSGLFADLHSGWPEAFSRPCCAIRWRIRTSLASLPVQAQCRGLYCTAPYQFHYRLSGKYRSRSRNHPGYVCSGKRPEVFNLKTDLIGIGVQAMLNAVVSYILEAGAEQDIATAMRWLSGSLNGVRLSELYLLLAAVLITTPVILVFSRQLAMLELGRRMGCGIRRKP